MSLFSPPFASTFAVAAIAEYPAIGRIQPRPAHEIASSTWSVGGETLDRDFAVFAHYREFLGPLGAKGIRVQSGWAKTERRPGVYEFTWLDEVVDGSLAQGVRPWLQFNYGNPIYQGGGDTGLGGGVPTSQEALAAWDRWARALVERYKDRVHEWEIWNEPDLTDRVPVEAYIDLYVRTATMVRELQPGSRLWALGMAGNLEYADAFLAGMQARGKLDLVDAITIHGYPRNPDDVSNIERLRAVISRYPREIEVRQGETGANSRYQEYFALRHIQWTENLQAKWNLRRMLAHRAIDVPFNLFSISDMHYDEYHREDGRYLRLNHKGLLATNPDRTIAYAKPSYHAAQYVFSIFDDNVRRLPDFRSSNTALRGVAVTGYEQTLVGGQIVAYWFDDAPPGEANGMTRATLVLADGRFEHPVLADLLTGTVYAIPAGTWTQDASGATFRDLPFYDSPLIIAEASAIPIERGQ